MKALSRSTHPVLIGISLLFTACSQELPTWQSGRLVIIVPEIELGAEAEFERELAHLFAEQMQSSLEIIPLRHHEVGTALREQRAHLAAASLRTETAHENIIFGSSYLTARELVVCKRSDQIPKDLAGLTGRKFAVVAGSAQEAALREAQLQHPSFQWEPPSRRTVMELLAEVADGELDCAAANELQLADARDIHPNLVAAFDIALPSRLAWGFPVDADPALLKQVELFFERIAQDGTVRRLLDRYFGHHYRLGRTDAAAFIARTKTILPRYRHLFEEASTLTGEDWRLLAALAYQESQWDPLATSYTNVRGMMMLTEDTADRMKLKNRLDARESILAGAKYLALLKEQLPARIPEPDRTWLALAAYNQGSSHLEDARILTHRAKLNPDRWLDVKKQMPLLSQRGYYETLKHGYSRGGEGVTLVENIRSYYGILKRLEPDRASGMTGVISYRLIDPLHRMMR